MSSAADVVIVGAGIAGCEAAWCCASNGLSVALVTTSLDTVYNLSHDAARLEPPPDSLMDSVAAPTESGTVRSRDLHRTAKYALEAVPNVLLVQSTVSSVLVDESGAARGVLTWEGVDRLGGQVALCVGSFLRARLTSGVVTETHGRLSEMAYDDLYQWLAATGFEFEEVRFVAEPHGGSMAYTVDTVALADRERAVGERTSDEHATGSEHRLWRVPGLWAAGACIVPPTVTTTIERTTAEQEAPGLETAARSLGDSYDYATVARQGMSLGRALVARTVRASAP